jgi:hypothetical protein
MTHHLVYGYTVRERLARGAEIAQPEGVGWMNDQDKPKSPDETDLSYEQDAQRQVFDSQGSWYVFRVKGHLAPCWSEWLDGLTIANLDNGETLLTGPVVDQAALHGLLAKVRDLNLPLISVNRIEPGPLGVSETGGAQKKTLP